ncbi:MAG: hypothetical protein H7246_03220 [Phycisphaerae bacterium]|nr:hypothetical protein [Saprospiraceae bacterium]
MQAAAAYEIKRTSKKIIVTLDREFVDEQRLADWLNFLRLEHLVQKANFGEAFGKTNPDASTPEKFDYLAYRERISKIGVWSDEDIALIEEARQHFNNWQIKEW